MPKLKRQRTTKNLGSYAAKKPRHDEDTEPATPPPRCSSPADSSFSECSIPLQDPLERPQTPSESSLLSAECDEFASDGTLLTWLKCGKKTMKKLTRKLLAQGEEKKKVRKPQYNTKIGGTPCDHTKRRHDSKARETAAAHGGGLRRFFAATTAAPAAQPVAPITIVAAADSVSVISLSDDSEPEENEAPGPLLPALCARRAWVEEILERIEREGNEGSSRTYRGSDPASSTPPPASSALPPPASHPSIRLGRPEFTHGDATFRPVEPGLAPGACALPSPKEVNAAIEKLREMLRPSRGANTRGYKHAEMNFVLKGRLELMLAFLRLYAADGYKSWGKAADTIAKSAGHGSWTSRKIREWTRDFLGDDTHLPVSQYGKFNESVLDDEDLSQEIHLHLQSLGQYISAQDVVNFMSSPEMKKRLNLKKSISVRTAQRWMKRNEYRWQSEPRGMYKDGHEREDVVDYRQSVFLPRWAEFSQRTRRWKRAEPAAEGNEAGAEPKKKKTKRQLEEEKWEEWEAECQREFIGTPDGKVAVIWRHDESIFYAHDRRKIRWVHSSESAKPHAKGEGKSLMVIAFVSPDYGWAARLLFRPGKNRDGYYGRDDILAHATLMMDQLDNDHPDEDHIFAYDNATTHTARAADALSALKMPVNTPGIDKDTNKQKNWFVKDENGKKIRMRDARFADGDPQPLYFPRGHRLAGVFKGMRVIINERRARGEPLPDPTKLLAQFATRSERFMDAYRKGLDGCQAAWAGKKYRGHRVLPKNILALFRRFGPKKQD
ncbi:hypothetical protein GGX14DRAFT_402382 [Mycena pura]|uniref:Uncharacterized protein n=1 Tax=Mycena pura TaxID=153505 RepID=A0AAD6Y9G8_9AGAR|nr:hypothetical protein GGX14DRAFT_402382 [Mycena pura]